MNYRPLSSVRLWDCWVFPWKDIYHLFHLQYTESGWGGLGHAVSEDFIHWTCQDTIEIDEVPDSWEASVGLTGKLVRHKGKFWMFYGASYKNVQRIGALISEDMKQWEKHLSNPLIEAKPPYHAVVRREGIPPPWRGVWWRDPMIYWRKDLGCYEGLIGARMPNASSDNSGACIARVRSKDLAHWNHLPPLVDVGEHLLVADVPDIFEINGTWYLTFNTCSSLGRRLDTPTRKQAGGTYYMIAPSPDGPFEFPEDPCLLGSGHGRLGPTVLATLTVEGHKNQRLAYHHIGPPHHGSAVKPAFAFPKYLRQNEDLTLSLFYHPVVEKLGVRCLRTNFSDIEFNRKYQLTGQWTNDGQRLHGYSKTVSSALLDKETALDINLSCRIYPQDSERCGILFRFDREKASGFAVTLDKTSREVILGPVKASWFGSLLYYLYDSVRWDISDKQSIFLRVIARAEFAEVYIDDQLALCVSLSEETKTGISGFFVEGGSAVFEDFRLVELEPLQ